MERFVDITGACATEAEFYLSAAEGNLEAALRAYTGCNQEDLRIYAGTKGRFKIIAQDTDTREYAVALYGEDGSHLGTFDWASGEPMPSPQEGADDDLENPDAWPISQETWRRWQRVNEEREKDATEDLEVTVRAHAGTWLTASPRYDPGEGSRLLPVGSKVIPLNSETRCCQMEVTVPAKDGETLRGWVHAHDVVGWKEGRQYEPMDYADWWETPWDVKAVEMSIWVRENSCTPEEIGEELWMLGLPSGNQRSNFLAELRAQKECTYVALGLGRLSRNGWQVCSETSHVTIGYLAWMWPSERAKLQEILVGILKRWRVLPPAERPTKLTRFRQFEVMTQEEKARTSRSNAGSYECRSARVGIMRRAYMELLIEEGRIDTPFRPEDEPIDDLVRRVHERDQHELRQAALRACNLRGVEELGGLLRLDRASDGLGESAELQDLLQYLTNAICHFASAFRRTNEGKLVHPCLACEERWHVSQQTNWLRRTMD